MQPDGHERCPVFFTFQTLGRVELLRHSDLSVMEMCSTKVTAGMVLLTARMGEKKGAADMIQTITCAGGRKRAT